jgi:hypothetical protein
MALRCGGEDGHVEWWRCGVMIMQMCMQASGKRGAWLNDLSGDETKWYHMSCWVMEMKSRWMRGKKERSGVVWILGEAYRDEP